jgi:hypothetical protein
MKQCLEIYGRQFGEYLPNGTRAYQPTFKVYQCRDDSENLSVVVGIDYGKGNLYLSDGSSEGCAELFVTVANCSNCPGCCAEPPPSNKHDCLNGGCIPASTYRTPGKYENLAACESGCAKDSSCDGECVSPSEIQALKQVASALQSKICK